MDFVSDDGELDEGGSQAQPASDCRFDDIDELGGTGGEDGEEESGELVDYSKDDEPGGGSKKHTAKQCQEPPPLSRSRFWERVGMRSLFTVGLLAEAGLALLIQNYHPAQSSTGTQWPYDSLGHNDPAETPRDLPNPLSEGSSGLAWNSVDQFDLHSKLRDLVREPGPAAFASSSAAFSLCLISLMQQTRHHRYQNHLIIFGMFCGLLTSILPIGRHSSGETLSASVLTAHVPAASVLALLISLLLHTAYSSWRGPVER